MHRWASSSWKLPVLSGLSLGVGYYVPVLVPLLVAFVPVLYWIDRRADEPRYTRFKSLFIFGMVAAIIGLHFCYAMFDFSWLAGVLWLAFAALLAIRVSLVMLLASWLRRRTGLTWGLLLPLRTAISAASRTSCSRSDCAAASTTSESVSWRSRTI